MFNTTALIDRFDDRRVLVIGDAMLDTYYLGNCQRVCQEAPVPIIEGCLQRDFSGGAANVAANLATLGAYCRFASVVGGDVEGDRLTQLLIESGVDTDFLIKLTSRQTLAKRRVMAGAQILLRFDNGTTSPVDDACQSSLINALEAEFPLADAIVVSDYGYGTLTHRIIGKLAELQSRYQKILTLDSRKCDEFKSVHPTLVKPNYREAHILLKLPSVDGERRLEQISGHARLLLEATGAKMAAVTLDRDGILLIDQDCHVTHLRALPVAETLTSGAGDSFLAAAALGLASGATLEQSGRLGRAAACVVTRGAFKRTCQRTELVEALQAPHDCVERSEMSVLLHAARRKGQTIVLTTGCFDILHRGHVAYLNEARQLGNLLVVGVNTDDSIRRLKGPQRPVNSLEDRMSVLSSLNCVDHVVAFGEDTPHRLISEIRPDIFVKGGDYTREKLPEADLVESLGGSLVFLPYLADRSTSLLIERIRNALPVITCDTIISQAIGHGTSLDCCCESALRQA